MKSALRFSLIIILLSIFSSTHAQTFRLETGYYNPGLRGADTSTTYFNSFRVGATVEFQLYKNISVSGGAMFNVLYSNKHQGYRNSQYLNYMTYGQTIDFPVRLTYSYPFSKDIKAFVYGGPNLRWGLNLNRGIVSTLDSANIKFTGQTSKMQNLYSSSIVYRLNLQLGVGGGLEWKKFMLKSGYDFGLFNMNREATTRKLYEGGWYITFGHQF